MEKFMKILDNLKALLTAKENEIVTKTETENEIVTKENNFNETTTLDMPPNCIIDENNSYFSPNTDNLIGLWNNDIHRTTTQLRRFKEADTVDILKYYSTTQTARVKGGWDDTIYTSLNSCSCADFHYRQRPCKHIYKLALEVGLIKEIKDLLCIPEDLKEKVNDTQEFIDSLPIYVKESMRTFQDDSNAQKVFEKNKHQKKLLNFGLIQEVEDIKQVVNYANTKDQILIALEDSTCKIKKPPKSTTKGKLIDWIAENDPETLRYLSRGHICLELTPQFKEYIKYIMIDTY